MDTRAQIALKDNAAFWEGARPAEELHDLDGLDRYEARELIVTLAEAQGWLDGIDAETHTVPHGDRSKVAIEPFLTDQWYVDAATLAEPALAGGARGPHPHPARARREDLFPLAGEHRALVHLAPALVGAPDPGLVWPTTSRRRELGRWPTTAMRRRPRPSDVPRARPLRMPGSVCVVEMTPYVEEVENTYRCGSDADVIVRAQASRDVVSAVDP